MSSLAKINPVRAKKVWFTQTKMYISLHDGRDLGIPLAWFPTLREATSKQLNNWRFVGDGLGIHWEDLDEDISVKSLLS